MRCWEAQKNPMNTVTIDNFAVGAGQPLFTLPLLPANVSVRRCHLPREKASRRILIVKLAAYGDVLMATPLVKALREAHPDAYITWMVERSYLQAIDANPDIDEMIVWEGDYWRDLLPSRWKKWLDIPKRWLGMRWAVQALKFRRQLRQRNFDVLISLHPEKWRLLLPGTGAPISIGVFESGRGLEKAYTFSHPIDSLPTHRTDKYLTALESLGQPEAVDKQMTLGYTTEDVSFVSAYLAERGVHPNERLMVIAPVTTWSSKCWPLDRYASLARMLALENGCKIVWIGSGAERSTIEGVANNGEAFLVAAGDFEFRQMAALIARSCVVISSDSAPMHAAAAVGTSYVGLFGATTPERYAPLSGDGVILSHKVPCGPCERMVCTNPATTQMLCMGLISVEEVYRAAVSLLEGAGPHEHSHR